MPRRRFRKDSRRRPLRIEPLEDRRVLAAVVVTNNLDVVNGTTTSISALIANPGADGISLREAITAANSSTTADQITFDFGHDGPEVIRLTQGELSIINSLTITGPGAGLLTIDASGNDASPEQIDHRGSRVMRVRDAGFSSAPVKLVGMTLTGGDVNARGGAIQAEDVLTLEDMSIVGNHASQNGGAIYATESLTLTRTTVSGNSSWAYGGGIYALGGLGVTDSQVVDNSAIYAGGGVYTEGSNLTLIRGEVSGNRVLNVEDGGGVYARNTRISVTGTSFEGNRAGRAGGAVYQYLGSSNINGASFDDNHAGSNGGAIYAFGSLTTSLQLVDSKLTGNTAMVMGGGIYSHTGSVSLQGTTLEDNHALSQGGGAYLRNLSLFVSGGSIRGNSATASGGGILLDEQTSAQISNLTLADNKSNLGGGVYAYRARSVTFLDSTIKGNRALEGAGVMVRESQNTLQFVRSTISGNRSAGNGAGVSTSAVDVFFRQSTVVDNHADSDFDADGTGGGVYARDGALVSLSGSIIARNSDNGTGPDVRLFNSFEAPRLNPQYSFIGSNVGNGRAEAPATAPDPLGNIVGGPIGGMIDPGLGPLADHGGPTLTHALFPGSPAIDAGDSSIAFDPAEFDQRGFARVANGGLGLRIDIGAYESQGIPDYPIGDFNHDGIANLADYTVWRDTLGSTTELVADASGNGEIDAEDYAIWKQHYGNTTIRHIIIPPIEDTEAALDAALAMFPSPEDDLSETTGLAGQISRGAEGHRSVGRNDELLLAIPQKEDATDTPHANPRKSAIDAFGEWGKTGRERSLTDGGLEGLDDC